MSDSINKEMSEIKQLIKQNARLDFEIDLIRAAKLNGRLDVLQFALDFVGRSK